MASRKKLIESAHDRDRIIIRLPDGMRQTLETFADANGRSMTAEVVAALEEHFARRNRFSALEHQVEQLRGELLMLRLRLNKLEAKDENDPTT